MSTTKKITVSVYRLTCVINGKKYIGICKSSVEKRWKRHIYDAGYGKLKGALQGAIKNYGKDNFEVSHICECYDEETAQKIERGFIAEENTIYPSGYNMTSGGEKISGHKISESTRKKMSDREISKETRNKMSASAKGRRASDETRKLLSLRSSGKHHTKEAKEKIRRFALLRGVPASTIEKSIQARINKSHCKNGHPFSGSNLYLYQSGEKTYRICKSCIKNRTKIYRIRDKNSSHQIGMVI